MSEYGLWWSFIGWLRGRMAASIAVLSVLYALPLIFAFVAISPLALMLAIFAPFFVKNCVGAWRTRQCDMLPGELRYLACRLFAPIFSIVCFVAMGCWLLSYPNPDSEMRKVGYALIALGTLWSAPICIMISRCLGMVRKPDDGGRG